MSLLPKKKPSAIARVFSRKRWRLVQRLTGIHRIHHISHSFGWTFPFTRWAFFEGYSYTVDFVFRSDYGEKKTKPPHWERLENDRSFHDCTATGRY